MRYFLFATILFLSACGNKGDYHSKFFKTYTGAVKSRAVELYLYRDYSEGAIQYSGTILDTIGGAPSTLSGSIVDTTKPAAISLYFQGSRDTFYQFTGDIAGDAGSLSGRLLVSVANKSIDSFEIDFKETPFVEGFKYESGSYTARGDGANFNINASFVWPVSLPDSNASKKLRSNLAKLVHIKNDTTTRPVTAYFASLSNDNYNGIEGGDREELSIVSFNHPIVTYRHTTEHYERGMAHPQWSSGFHTYNIETGDELKLSDLFDADARASLKELVPKYFRMRYGLKPDEPLTNAGLFRNFIDPNNNYYISGNSLVFHYSNYEIAPFALGEFTVAIPLAGRASNGKLRVNQR